MRRPRVSKSPPFAEPVAQAPTVAPITEPPARKRVKSKRTPELEVNLGARIRSARVAAQMSQTALGEAVGITFQQIQKYELGKDRVAASTLQIIAAALGVHPGSFFDNEPSTPNRDVTGMRALVRIAERIQQIPDPVVLKRLLAFINELAKVKAEVDDADEEQPTTGSGEGF